MRACLFGLFIALATVTLALPARAAVTQGTLAMPSNSLGLVGHWTFDGANMISNVADSSGSGDNGVLTGFTSTSTVPGVFGQALQFPGTNENRVVAGTTGLPSGNVAATISMWFSFTTCYQANEVLGGFGAASSLQSFQVDACAGSQFYVLGWGSDWGTGVPSAAYRDGTWHLATATYSGSADHVTSFYIDGVLLARTTSYTRSFGTTSVILGNEIDGGGRAFRGNLDDFRIYNRALAPSEVAALYHEGAGNRIGLAPGSHTVGDDVSNLLAHWTLDIADDTSNLADVTGHGYSAFLSGATTTTTGAVGDALTFNGTNMYASFPVAGLPYGAHAATMCGWGRPSSISAGFHWIITYGTAAGSQALILGRNGSGLDAGGYGSDLAIANYWAANVWHFVCVTTNGVTESIYGDGILLGQVGKTWNLVQNVGYLGRSVNGGEYWNGDIDDVRIYSRALTSSDIQQLYYDEKGTHPGATLDPGLVGHWTFDGKDMIQNVADSSGSGNNGYLGGFTATTTVPGVLGQALTFNGSSQYVTTGYTIPAQSSATSFTWSVWVRLATGNASNLVIMGYRNGTTWIKMTPTALEYSSGSIISYAVPTGTWVLLTVVKDGSSFTYYKNGVVVGTATNAGSAVSHTLYLGEDPGYLSDGALSGTLDDARVYNRALSATEVAHLYQQGAGSHQSTTVNPPNLNNGLVGHWTFDGKDMIGNVADSSGSGHNGYLVGFTSTTTVPGVLGQALSFNGSVAQYVAVGTGATFATQNAPFSFSAWFYARDYNNVVPEIMQLISDSGNSFHILVTNTSGYEGISFGSNDTWADTKTNSVPSLNVWHHLILIYNGNGAGTRSNFSVYLDGVLQTLAASGSYGITGTNTIGNSTGDTTTQWSGAMDDIRIYNRALSAAEVKQLYKLGH